MGDRRGPTGLRNALTAGFRQGQIVRVPFPYTDRNTRQNRPALIVSNGKLGDAGALLWVVMITSSENRGWPDDQDIGPDYVACGLPAPSVIRPSKIATIEASHATAIGQIPPDLLAKVMAAIRFTLSV
jgi:mRNA interferase MazF